MNAPAPKIDIALPTTPGGWKCIVADPPWSFKQYSDKIQKESARRDVQRHYKTMSLSDISGLPVAAVAARDAHLFLWVTGPRLAASFEIIKAWGFKYSAVGFVWVKQKRSLATSQLRFVLSDECDLHVGLGFTTRKNAEFCLLARRGSPKREARDVREIIMSPVREHSRKPDEFYARVDRYCVGPRLDLFGRQSRQGWTTWGNEATKFDEAAA